MAGAITFRAALDASDFKTGLAALAASGQSAMASLATAAGAAGKALDGVAAPADRSAAATARLQRSADNFRASIDPLYAAQLRYDRELDRANGLLARGGLTTQQHAAAVVTLKDRLTAATAALQGTTRAHGDHAASMGASRMQIMEYGHVFRSVTDSIIAGQSPIRAVAQELPRIGQAAASGAGGLSALSVLLNPVTIGIALVTGAFVLGTAAALSYDAAQRRLAASITYGGQASGATVAQMEAIAEAAAKAGKATEGQARAAEAAFVTTGQVASGNLEKAVDVVNDFAAATGQKTPQALEELAKALAKPGEGADALNQKLHFLGAAQLDNIAQLERQGDLAGAQRVLLDELAKSVAGAADNVNGLAAAWNHVADGAASAWNWLGKAVTRAASGPTDTERLATLTQSRDALQGGKITGREVIQSGLVAPGTADVLGALNAQIAPLKAQAAAAQAKAEAATVAARNRNESVTADKLIEKASPQQTAIEGLEQDRKRLLDDLPLAKAGKLPGVTGDDVQRGIDGLDKQIAEAKRREGAAGRRAASEAETAADKAAEAEKTTRSAEEKAQQEGLRAALQIASARGEQAKAVLTAAASDATLTTSDRAARIKETAAQLTTANAADQRLKIEIDQITEAKRAAVEQAESNRKLSQAQKARIVAAVTAASKAREDAARAEDQTRQVQAQTTAQGAGQTEVKTALGIVAGSDSFSVAQRAAAQARLAELQRSEEQARLETILAEKGVSDSTKAQARTALDLVQALKPSAAVQDQIGALQRDLLTGAQGLATTSAQRLEAEKALLALAQDQRRAQLEVLLSQLPPGSDALAQRARGAVGAVDAQEKESLRVRNLNPLEKDAKAARDADPRDLVISDVQQGLHGLGAELVSAARAGQNFGQVLSNAGAKIFDKIAGDLVEKAVIGPVEGWVSSLLPQTLATTTAAASTDAMTAATDSATAALTLLSQAAASASLTQGLGGGLGGLGGLFGATSAGGAAEGAGLEGVLSAGGGLLGAFLADGGPVPGFAAGSRALSGRISGPGTGRSDSIIAMVNGRRPIAVSTGETIVNASASQRWAPVLDAMNRGAMHGYASGGTVGSPGGAAFTGGGGGVIINDMRTTGDPAPKVQQKANGDTVIDLKSLTKQMIRGNPEAVRDAAYSAGPKVTRRGA